MFAELGDYENSAEMVKVCKYTHAAKLVEAKDYASAKAIFVELGEYADSANFARECTYQQAIQLLRNSRYSIKEIAMMTGFNDQNYFNKAIRRHFHHNPSWFRDDSI